jgi:hypothetical protein
MLAVWFISITWQVFFNVLFVVILKMFLEDMFFIILPLLVDSQKTMYMTLFTQNAIILEHVKMGEKRNAYMVIVGKSEEKSPFGRPKHRSHKYH